MSAGKHCEAVRVVVRCRPFSRREETAGCENILEVDDKSGQITIRNPKAPPEEPMKVFTFDSVYGWNSKQRDIYEDAVRPSVESVSHGFNGTIFAYGQTGTGKTHTMQGVSKDPEKRGIIPISFEHIFTQISRSQNQKYSVRSSYLEIYQEEIRDSSCKDNNKKSESKENPDFGVYVKDLSSVVTKNATEIEHVMNLGNQSRSVGFTNMNERSSRSHAIFLVTVECSERGPDGEDHIRVGKSNMVDSAGSERQSKTGAKGKRSKEAAKINSSLSASGNVISASVDRKSTHVPYRDSKSTRSLQDSLGGNAKTVMIATVGPAHKSFDETSATSRYASRAKKIRNKPRINEDPKDASSRQFQEEIARSKAQLEERGMSAKERRRRRRDSKRSSKSMAGMEEEFLGEKDGEEWKTAEEAEDGRRPSIGPSDNTKISTRQGSSEKSKNLNLNRRSSADMQWDQDAVEKIIEKYKAMESKSLVGGKTIIDHTNEQQKMSEQKRQEIAEQIRREREIQQQMMSQDEETLEIKETFSSSKQEVEHKTKKSKRSYAKLQSLRGEMKDLFDEHVTTRQELEETQEELTRELKYKYLLIENFIPPEEKNKIMNRSQFDSEEDQWWSQPVIPSESTPIQVKRRPLSAVGYKRPISQYAQMAVATTTGTPFRYQAENVMSSELDMSPPTMFTSNLNGESSERAVTPRLIPDSSVNVHARGTSSSRVRKSQSWYQAPQTASVPSSSSSTISTSGTPSCSPSQRQRPSSALYLSSEEPLRTSP